MTLPGSHPPQPVAGEVIGRSVVKTIGSMLLVFVFFLIGLFMIWAWWTETAIELPFGRYHVKGLGFVVGIASTLFCPLMIAYLVFRLLVPDCLILGPDRLQMARKVGGKDVVYLQIPYRNIDNLAYESTQDGKYVGINLKDLQDPDTYARPNDFLKTKKQSEWHCLVRGGYKASLPAIHKKLLEKMRQAG
jgi:hypothetical protein